MELKKRMQSPSSINTYNQCPRKYYYHYIEKLGGIANIHQVRGNIAHKVLEEFFDIDLKDISDDNFETHLRFKMQFMLLDEWKKNKRRLDEFNLTEEQEIFYFEETLLMLMNWLDHMIRRIKNEGSPYNESFSKLIPIREKEYKSWNLYVRGFIDAVEIEDKAVRLIDYKTSASYNISDSYKLQLGIYALLYQEKHGYLPDQVGIFFLKNRLRLMNVDDALIRFARKEITKIHENTKDGDIGKYPKSISRLCKWSTGQCDFYGLCFNGKEEEVNVFVKRF